MLKSRPILTHVWKKKRFHIKHTFCSQIDEEQETEKEIENILIIYTTHVHTQYIPNVTNNMINGSKTRAQTFYSHGLAL